MGPKKGGKSGRGKKGAGKSRKGGEGVSTVSSKAGCKGKSAKSTPPSRSPSIERDEISNIEEDLAELIDQEMTKSPRASDMEDSPPNTTRPSERHRITCWRQRLRRRRMRMMETSIKSWMR